MKYDAVPGDSIAKSVIFGQVVVRAAVFGDPTKVGSVSAHFVGWVGVFEDSLEHDPVLGESWGRVFGASVMERGNVFGSSVEYGGDCTAKDAVFGDPIVSIRDRRHMRCKW